jgi:hypothetical protein
MNYENPGLITSDLLASVQGEDGSGQPCRRLLRKGGRQISPEVSTSLSVILFTVADPDPRIHTYL